MCVGELSKITLSLATRLTIHVLIGSICGSFVDHLQKHALR